MITRLEVDGFKSLRNFAIDFAPFTVLVGPNSSGKSNILEALALLSHLSSEPIEAAFKHGRGRAIDQFTREKGEPVRAIRFAAELLLPVDIDAGQASTNRVRYELTIGRERRASGAEALVVDHERLTTIPAEHDEWLDRYPALVGRAHSAPGVVEILCAVKPSSKDMQRAERRLRYLADEGALHVVPGTHTAVVAAMAGAMAHEPEAAAIQSARSAVGRLLSALRLIHLDAATLRGESERIGGAELLSDASNLPTVLAALPPRVLGEIRAELVALVPGISTFDVVADRENFLIEIELSGGDRLPARLVSDGTLRALALLTALRARPFPSIIAVEEPENGIYPGRLRALLELLREASERRDPPVEADADQEGDETHSLPPQVLLTSHSPVVLAAVHQDVAGLRFIDTVRRAGHLVTRARRIGPPAPGERGQNSVPIREIDALLSLSTSEAAE